MSRVVRNDSDGRIQLSQHYYLDDFTIDALPAPTVIQNLFRQAAAMERIRALLPEGAIYDGFIGYVDPEVGDFMQLADDHPLRYAGAVAFQACEFRGAFYRSPAEVVGVLLAAGIPSQHLSVMGASVLYTLEP